MIGKLRGIVDSVEGETCVIDVGGVGYVAFCPSGTLAGLKEGEEAVLHVETVVREDMIRLYGFSAKSEREWFRALQANVQGVGAKVALSVLSALSPASLAAAVRTGDLAAICKAQGVGKKVAERIIAEMKGKMPDSPGEVTEVKGHLGEQAVGSLVALGYPRERATSAVARALDQAGTDADLAAVMRLAIRNAAAA